MSNPIQNHKKYDSPLAQYNLDLYSRASRGIFVTARSGTGTFSPPQAEFFWGLPEQLYGKTFPFVYRGMGTGREGGKAEG